VEEIARLYVEAMQEVQPNGPYNIVSMCAGSFIALEMSHLVEVADGTVARLILIDPHPEPDEPSPDGPHSAGRNNLRINARLKAVAKFFVESVINISSNGHRGQPLRSQRLREKIRMGREINTDWIENSTDVPEAMLRSVRQLRKALRKCRPHPFSGKGVMLLTSERQNQVLESGSFWRTHLDGIDYQVCDWDHRSLFSVHLLETARFVRNALEMPFDPRLMPGALIGQI
jgi:thioesterase domain-containing protein